MPVGSGCDEVLPPSQVCSTCGDQGGYCECPECGVRTTGWLQIGSRPISSGAFFALGGFAVGLLLVGLAPWLPLLPALAGYGVWFVLARHLRPASPAVNVRTVPARALGTGQWVRLYGSIGPVGRVEQVRPVGPGQLVVRLCGGVELVYSATWPCRLIELRA